MRSPHDAQPACQQEVANIMHNWRGSFQNAHRLKSVLPDLRQVGCIAGVLMWHESAARMEQGTLVLYIQHYMGSFTGLPYLVQSFES